MGLFGLFGKSKKQQEMEYLESIGASRCLQENFEMKIVDTFTLAGKGTVVVGQIASGSCRVGEEVCIVKSNGERLYSTITGIDVRLAKRKPNDCGYKNEHAGIGLRGITKAQLEAGDMLMIENAYQHEG